MPLAVAADLMLAIDGVCRKHGLEAYFREADGIKRVFARPLQRVVPSGPTPR